MKLGAPLGMMGLLHLVLDALARAHAVDAT
jgi:hypothetical protein